MYLFAAIKVIGGYMTYYNVFQFFITVMCVVLAIAVIKYCFKKGPD